MPLQVSPGGSLANTLVAMSRLSQAHGNHNRLALAGCVGSDTLGSYFNAQLGQAGVDVLVDQDNLCHTGTVMVSVQGTSLSLVPGQQISQQSSKSRLLMHCVRLQASVLPVVPSWCSFAGADNTRCAAIILIIL